MKITAVTPFGLTGPFRDYAASDLTVLASGGMPSTDASA